MCLAPTWSLSSTPNINTSPHSAGTHFFFLDPFLSLILSHLHHHIMMTHNIVDSTTTTTATNTTTTSSNNNITSSTGSQYASHHHFHLHPSSPPYSTSYPPPPSRTDPPHTSKRDQSIPALLNSDDDEHDFLPTPVTPAGAFSSILPLSEQLKHSTATTNTTTTSANEAALTLPSPGVSGRLPLQQHERSNKESIGGKSNNSKQGHANLNQPSATTEKLYACHECDQTFSRPHNLKSHLATHSSEKPYQVKYLQKGYKAHGQFNDTNYLAV